MPRTYRYDHFTVPKTVTQSRSLRRRDKQQLAGTRAADHRREEGLHYGRSHAETEEMLQVKAMNAQLETLAGLSANAPVKPSATHRGQPIGALPVPGEPPPRGSLGDVLDEGRRQLGVLQAGLRDASRATGRLLSLPLEVARMTARRLRLVPRE
jgi:hypothetical protein